jgi:hypothetical protein
MLIIRVFTNVRTKWAGEVLRSASEGFKLGFQFCRLVSVIIAIIVIIDLIFYFVEVCINLCIPDVMFFMDVLD